jgi:hypothetical protein
MAEDDGEQKTYRVHLATVPGSMAGKISMNDSQPTHLELIKLVEGFLESMNIKCQVPDPSGFSCTDDWAVELYGCIMVTCTRTIVRGLCALFGMAFRQDAVGVFSCYTTDKDDPHNVFLLSRFDQSPVNRDEALKITKLIQGSYPMLSAQCDEIGASMEFHDYCNEEPQTTGDEVLQLLRIRFPEALPYTVKKDLAHSFLLCEEQYTEAIEKAGLKPFELMIRMCQAHSKSY